jgi:SM-20-related protein
VKAVNVNAVESRCPHLVYRDVLGMPAVTALLEYVVDRRADFRAGKALDRRSGRAELDVGRRDCALLADLGPFRAKIEGAVRGLIGPALAELRLNEPGGEPASFEISSYGDGGHFNAHVDVDAQGMRGPVRILSCVYYFAATPRRFGGGELRLHALPKAFDDGAVPSFVDVEPETDSLVMFASWLRHEVRPVRLASPNWADRRFAINCWIRRPA